MGEEAELLQEVTNPPKFVPIIDAPEDESEANDGAVSAADAKKAAAKAKQQARQKAKKEAAAAARAAGGQPQKSRLSVEAAVLLSALEFRPKHPFLQ